MKKHEKQSIRCSLIDIAYSFKTGGITQLIEELIDARDSGLFSSFDLESQSYGGCDGEIVGYREETDAELDERLTKEAYFKRLEKEEKDRKNALIKANLNKEKANIEKRIKEIEAES